MNEQPYPAGEAVNAADPGMAGGTHSSHEDFQARMRSFTRVSPLIMSPPGDMDLGELLLLFRRREL